LEEEAMEPTVGIIVAVVVIAVAVVIIALAVARRRRKASLRQEFGPEYDRAVREMGSEHAETVLRAREKRVAQFSLRELSPSEWQSFTEQWRIVQSRFVDDPVEAVAGADELVDRLMAARGYPVSDFEQRAADISVGHALVVEHYRAAHAIALRHRAGQATTEDLRNALIHYRALFTELLEQPDTRRAPGKKAVA
jgi:hypothetical protein